MCTGWQSGFAFLKDSFVAKDNSLSQNQKFFKFAYVLPHLAIHKVSFECKRQKRSNNINYNSNNKTKLKIFFNVRGQYLCSRAKLRGITLNIMQ